MYLLITMVRLVTILSLLFACTACAQRQPFQNWKRVEAPAVPVAKPVAKKVYVSVLIDLSDQRAYMHFDGRVVYQSHVSTGRKGHQTPTGTFKVTQKDIDHRSSIYGQFVDAQTGAVIKDEVDTRKDVTPLGQVYRGCPMSYFMRINGAIGMHQGHCPGYPASHGCIRLPKKAADTFYKYCPIGTPVTIQQ